MKTRSYFLIVVLFLAGFSLSGKDYAASSFGIKSNGTTLNTTSIQKAIDFISENGGGRLVFKVGRYLTGTIVLKDNVTIELGEGAILVGSTNPYDYIFVNGTYGGGLVTSNGAKNIGITGLGVIEGQGTQTALNFFEQVTHGYIQDRLANGRVARRPDLIYLFESKNIRIEGINVNNACNWTLVCERCDSLEINGVTVNSRAYWNNDGIDIVDCTNTFIHDCFVTASDDGICLKSHHADYGCDNVVVRHNTVISSASGIKFGTMGYGGFRNIRIVDNIVYDTFRSAIAIESVDGGMTENIVVDSLQSYNTANPIYLVVGSRNGKTSGMRGVRISNVYAEVPAKKMDLGVPYEGPTLEDEPRNVTPCAIVGLDGNPVSDVTFEHVEIKFPGGGNPAYARVGLKELDKVPEMPTAYPEFSQFKELPAWGVFIRHATGIRFNDVKISAETADYRPAIVLHDVDGGIFTDVEVAAPKLKGTIFSYKSKNIRKIKKQSSFLK